MKERSKIPERRRNPRFAVVGNPLAVMRPFPSGPGKLMRISRETAEIIYCLVNGSAKTKTAEIDILVPDFTRGMFLEKIPVTTVSELPVSAESEGGFDRMRKRVVSFDKLTTDQMGQLRSFIYSYAK